MYYNQNIPLFLNLLCRKIVQTFLYKTIALLCTRKMCKKNQCVANRYTILKILVFNFILI